MRAWSQLILRLRQLREVHREFASLVRREKKLLILSGVALTAETTLQLASAWPIKYLVDGLLLPPENGEANLWFVPAGYPTEHPANFVVAVCAALLFMSVAATTCGYFRQVWSATAGQRMVLRLRKRLYAHLQKLSLRFHRDSRHGDLIARITGDIPALRDILSETLVDLVGRVALALATLIILFCIDPVLALVSVGTLTLVLGFSLLWGRRIARVARRQRKKEGVIAHTAGETLSSVALVKAYGAEDALVDRFARQNRSSMRQGVAGTRLQAALSRYVEICFSVGIAVVLAVGTLRVFESAALTAGTLLVFVSYVRSLHKPLRKLSRASARIGKASACADRILEILDTEIEEVDAPEAVDAPPLRGDVTLEGVSFSHVPEVPVLENLDLTLTAGERIALVGSNGAGKTTLLHLLLRFYEPERGVIRFDGVDATSYTIASVRAQIALALQETYLFGNSVRENLSLAAEDASDESMLDALRLVSAEFLTETENPLDTELAEGGRNLSGGERRKVMLAGALLRQAPILILDEPTTHIDMKSRDDLLDRFDQIARGRTTLVVTHDAELLPRVDRVIHLEQGRIVEAGPHEELLARSPRYRRLFASEEVDPSILSGPEAS